MPLTFIHFWEVLEVVLEMSFIPESKSSLCNSDHSLLLLLFIFFIIATFKGARWYDLEGIDC